MSTVASSLSCTPHISTVLSDLKKLFSGAVNILIVDDNPHFHSFLSSTILTSSLLSVRSIFSLAHAAKELSSSKIYYCTIFGLRCNCAENSAFLFQNRRISYGVIFSHPDTTSPEASLISDRHYFIEHDKNTFVSSPSAHFIYSLFSIISVSFLLNTLRPRKTNLFDILHSDIIHSPEEWADRFFHCQRSVRDICKLYSDLTPTQFLSLFYSIQYTILSDFLAGVSFDISPLISRLGDNVDFFNNCINYVLDNTSIYSHYF